MLSEKFFPTVLIILQAAAMVGYMPAGQWWKVLYWFAAVLITTAVTYGMK